jgi:ribosomal protein L37AE/L43A
MGLHVDHFECDSCQSKDFMRVYNFSLRFHGVNFSDELIYDQQTSEVYQCMGCKKRFTRREIEEGLAGIRRARREKTPLAREG